MSTNRITIIGRPGAGKSTLAKKISEHYKLPYFSADEILKKYSSTDTKNMIKELVLQDHWVFEGKIRTYKNFVLPFTDHLIFVSPEPKIYWNRLFNREILGGGKLPIWNSENTLWYVLRNKKKIDQDLKKIWAKFKGKKTLYTDQEELQI